MKKFLKTIPSLILILLIAGLFFVFQNDPDDARADWWNDSWQFRQSIQVTNNVSEESNVYISVTLNTNTASTSMQADCGDFRFTKESGEVLPYYISSGCRTTNNVIHVNFDTFVSGEQTIYFYYGNPSAENGFEASDFATEASNYTIGAVGAEEVGGGPVGYWSFDEGYGTTAHDASSNKNDGTISGAVWKNEEECVSGKCLFFDGANDSVSISGTISNAKTVNFWVKSTSTTASFVDLNGSAYISSTNGSVSASGFTSPTIYINAKTSSDFNNQEWQMITIVTDTGIDAGTINIGKISSNYFGGYIDEVKIYPYARSADQVKQDYNAGLAGIGSSKGVSVSFGGSSDKWMSDGLVGYWKMDETATTSGAIDSSGNGNDGVYEGSASTTAGKFGHGGVFGSSTNDFVTVEENLVTPTVIRNMGITYSAWFKTNDVNQIQIIVGGYHSISQDSNTLGAIKIYENGKLGFTYYEDGEGYRNYGENLALSANQWYHGVLTYNSSDRYFRLYRNGELVKESGLVNAPGIMSQENGYVKIGGNPNEVDDMMNGNIDEVRIYNRALSPEEVRKLYEWAPGPVAHWKMDEKVAGDSKIINDSSGYGNQGTTTDGSNNSGMDCTRPGKYGTACEFDGVDDSVYMGVSSFLQPKYSFTYGAWVRLNDLEEPREIIVSYYNYDTFKGVELRSENSRSRYFFLIGLGNNRCSVASIDNSLEVNKWQYVSAVYDGTYLKLYVDGLLSGLSSNCNGSAVYYDDTKNFYLGSGNHSENKWHGKIDDVRIYNYARTQKQILEDMNAGRPARKSPVLHLSFDEGYGGTAHDSSIYANDGTTYVGTGGTQTATSSMWEKSGKFKGAMEFDGMDDFVAIPNFKFPNSNQFSMSKWINVKTLATAKPIISQWGNSQNNILIKTDDVNSDELRICIGSSLTDNCTNYAYTTNADLSLDSWEYLNIIYDGSQSTNASKLKLFINGIEISLSFSGTIPNVIQNTATSDLRIAGNSDLSAYFNGLIDEVKIWNYALGAEEIQQEYSAGETSISLGGGKAEANNNGSIVTGNSAKYCIPGDTATCTAPVLELDFDEKAGEVAYDTSGNGNDGILINSPLWQRGINGSALSFNGTTSYVRVPHSDILEIPGAMTISAWAYSSGVNGDESSMVSKREIGGYAITPKYCSFYRNGVGTAVNHNFNSLSAGWYYITCVYSGRYTYSYIDGVLKNYDDAGANYAITYTYDNALLIGAEVQSGEIPQSEKYFNGLVDEVRIYNYARTPAQIAWDYNRGKPIAHYSFDECQGSIIHDESENKNHGVLNLGTAGVTATGTCASSSDSFWYNGRSGKRNYSGSFDGTDDYINIGDTGLNISSVSFWMKQDYTDNYMIDLGGGDYTITLVDSAVTTTGFSSPTIYVDGINKTTIPDNAWHHILVTSATAIDASSTKIGLVGSDYFSGQIDELKLYNYDLTGEQAKTDFSGGAVGFGYSGFESGSALVLPPTWTCGSSQLEDIDGNLYNTAQIGTQCWMAENLMVSRNADGSAVDGSGDVDTTPPGAYGDTDGGHDGADANWEETEGYFYNWQDAMNGSTLAGAQGICPDGWHLPTHDEWTDLERYICEQEGTDPDCNGTFPKDTSTTGWRGTNEGTELKNETNVNGQTGTDPNGDNGYDFAALLAGRRYNSTGAFNIRGTYGVFWSSSEFGSNAWYRNVYSTNAGVSRNNETKADGFSVRCVRN